MIARLVAFVNGTSFHRGLALGALVGAAIAGSTIWGRIRGGLGYHSGDAKPRSGA